MMVLEVEVAHLSNMAEILADLLDTNMVDARGGRQPDDDLTIVLTAGQASNLAFAWNDVQARAARFEKACQAAFKHG